MTCGKQCLFLLSSFVDLSKCWENIEEYLCCGSLWIVDVCFCWLSKPPWSELWSAFTIFAERNCTMVEREREREREEHKKNNKTKRLDFLFSAYGIKCKNDKWFISIWLFFFLLNPEKWVADDCLSCLRHGVYDRAFPPSTLETRLNRERVLFAGHLS